ncbi:YaaL family protein [Clostridium uliginosum]|uniref:Uncharacterized protein n=1 Tax=Clostridium uliginosum TaxID=119641 RepID=A0A1I1P779_9CLOT|nr:YaaL family protein [Clostridium uliginosum]SFD05811.1 Protein of unknown function [Clostridium uliginosum]
MNKRNILEYLLDKTDGLDINEQLLEQMEIAKSEIDAARSMFNNVNDSKLIEVAIYSEEVAKKRYEYLLLIAKSRGLSVSHEYVLQKNISGK